ncbi:MAG: flavin reductase family protein [Phycisphaerales bacterium JB063]
MGTNHGRPMDEALRNVIGQSLGAIPSGRFVLTAAHEDRRLGTLVGWVQQACFEPPMVSVAVCKGTPIMPLISESRHFGLCQLGAEDRTLIRKFANVNDPGDDPFLGMTLIKPVSQKTPILSTARVFLECELTCHMDVEGDHDLFIGTVLNAGYRAPFDPALRVREDGYSY